MCKQDINTSFEALKTVENMEEQADDPLLDAEAVWKAVILQAVVDACSESTRTEDQVARMQALSWLKGNSEDFVWVATSAGWSPEFVKEQAAKAIATPQKWRRVPHNKKYKHGITKEKSMHTALPHSASA